MHGVAAVSAIGYCRQPQRVELRLLPVLTIAAALCAHAATESPPAAIDYAGHQLPQEPGLYERWDPTRSWGTSVLVETLAQVAHDLALIMPEAEPLLIGDVSVRGGGPMPGHFTHRTGNDVDIGLFFHSGHQPHGGFVDVAADELDVPATWTLISTLMATDRVQFILLDDELIGLLRDYGIHELHLPREVVERTYPPIDARIPWSERNVVRDAENHRSHMHVRITMPEVELGT